MRIFALILATFVFFPRFGLTQSTLGQVFPQVADGRFNDGSFYISTFLIINRSEASPLCRLSLSGVSPQRLTRRDGSTTTDNPVLFRINSNGWEIFRTAGTQPFSRGWAFLYCGEETTFHTDIDAQVLFSFHDRSGTKLSEATVFSSRGAYHASGFALLFLVDQREGERFGIAVQANRDYGLFVEDEKGNMVRRRDFTRGSSAWFLDEVANISAGFVGRVALAPLSAGLGEIHAIGLRFSGPIFTTIPAIVCHPPGRVFLSC